MAKRKPDPLMQKMRGKESALLLFLERDWKRLTRIVNRMSLNRKALIRLRKRIEAAQNTPRTPGSNGKDE